MGLSRTPAPTPAPRRCGGAGGAAVAAAMSTRGGAGFAAPPARMSTGSEPGEDGAPLRVRWALRRALYGLDSVASSPAWQTAFLLVLAVAITVTGGAVLHSKTVHNNMHTNEGHDTSYSVRGLPRSLEVPPLGRARPLIRPHASQESVWLAWVLLVDPASLPYADGALEPKRPRLRCAAPLYARAKLR